MNPASLAETIKDALIAQDVVTTAGYDPNEMLILNAMDPAQCFEGQHPRIWIVPVSTEYDLRLANKRGQIKSLVCHPVISIMISKPLDTFSKLDVCDWAEVNKVFQLRMLTDVFIATKDWGLTIVDIRDQPPVEVNMSIKWFLSITEFVFEYATC